LLAAVAAAVVLAAIVAGAIVLWLRHDSGTSDANAANATPSVPLTPARAQEIAAEMTSGDEAQLRQAVALPPSGALDPALLPGLAGVELDIDPDSYTPTGQSTATVQADVADAAGARSRWVLELLLNDAGTWQVLDTVAQENG
jgi:hypothetical protein